MLCMEYVADQKSKNCYKHKKDEKKNFYKDKFKNKLKLQ